MANITKIVFIFDDMLCDSNNKIVMLTIQKIIHIGAIGLSSIIYSCYIIQMLHPSNWVVLFLALYFILFFIYTLKTYAIFHYPPTQPNQQLPQNNTNAIFKYKLTQERRLQLQQKLKHKSNDRKAILQQYIDLHKTDSFCDHCANIQPPRAHHCFNCNTCIMGKHFHSVAIGYCIGDNNQLQYLNYVFISAMICTYSFCSLVVAQCFSQNFDKFNIFVYVFYYLMLVGYINGFLYFMSTTLDFVVLIRSNQTYVEWTHPVLGKFPLYPPNPEKINYQILLKDMVDFTALGQVSSWVAQVQDFVEQ